MAEKMRPQKMRVEVIKAASSEPQPIIKSDVSTQVLPQDAYNSGEWLSQPYNLDGLRAMVNHSTILPQCIRAYKNNICGFGIGVRYKEDVEETPEMAAEFDKMKMVIDQLTTEQDTKEVFENIIEAREIYGIAYLEVIRDFAGDVVQIEFVKETSSMYKTQPLKPYIETEINYGGGPVKRKKRFCKYCQQLGGETVFFKEFGDPRIMDLRSGEYIGEGGTLELENQANEILEFSIGTMPYGEVRWLGQILGVDGSRRAEILNNNYFINGRHTPLMIMIENGTLSDESYEKLQEYMEDIKGENGQHAFIILETEGTDSRVDFEPTQKPTVQIKELGAVLQKDELFQDYINNGRKKVQSAFLLPDIYTGYTTDFNRATAQTAQEVTEKQVFQPERKSLAWAINNKLLSGYNFQHVEAYFLEPQMSNPDDTYKMLTALNSAGGLTMNKAKDLLYKLYGETSEDYDKDWGNLPLSLAQQQMQQGSEAPAEAPAEGQNEKLSKEVQMQIEKATANNDDEIVAVLKEVRNLLKSERRGDGDFFEQGPDGTRDEIEAKKGEVPRNCLQSGEDYGIIQKYNKNHDEKGLFANGDSSDVTPHAAPSPQNPRDLLEERISNGVYKTTVNPEKQDRHFQGTKEYVEETKKDPPVYHSFLTIDPGDVQILVDKYTKEGTAYYSHYKNGAIRVQFMNQTPIGMTCNPTDGKDNEETRAGMIIYSKAGTHLCPIKEWGEDKNE